MSTSQRAVMPCDWGVKAGLVRVWVAGETVWSPCCMWAISERFRDKELIIKRCINSPSLLYFTALNAKLEVDLWHHGRHLEKSVWRHNFAVVGYIWMKCDRSMQNDVQVTTNRLESKPEIEFQYGRIFSETGSSNISAVDEISHYILACK